MKRSNKTFFAGLLCFSLGYIAHDIMGEAGVKLAGSASAFPVYSSLPQNLTSAREISKDHQALLIGHVGQPVCAQIDIAVDALVSIWTKSYYTRHREGVGYVVKKELKKVESDLKDVRMKICHH